MNLDTTAPTWAHKFRDAVVTALEQVWTRPLPIFTVATLPSPTDKKWLWRLAVVTDGAANKWVVTTNGTAWRYLEGTAV